MATLSPIEQIQQFAIGKGTSPSFLINQIGKFLGVSTTPNNIGVVPESSLKLIAKELSKRQDFQSTISQGKKNIEDGNIQDQARWDVISQITGKTEQALTQGEFSAQNRANPSGLLSASQNQSPNDIITVAKGDDTRDIQRSQLPGFLNAGFTVTNDPISRETPSSSQGGQAYDFETYSDLPDSVRNTANWNSLSDEQKKLVYFTYKTQTATNEADKIDAQNALEQAIQLADPYFKEQIRIAQDEIGRSITSTQGDITTQTQRLNDRILQLKQDLATGKSDLTIEQQAELARELRQNQVDLNSLQQSAAEAGLAFSSPRDTAESMLKAQQQDIAESNRRRFARAQRDLQTQAERGITSAQQGIADVQTKGAQQLTNIQRAGETSLGTQNAPTVPGVAPLGGVTGTLPESRQQQLLGVQNTLRQRQQPFSFN